MDYSLFSWTFDEEDSSRDGCMAHSLSRLLSSNPLSDLISIKDLSNACQMEHEPKSLIDHPKLDVCLSEKSCLEKSRIKVHFVVLLSEDRFCQFVKCIPSNETHVQGNEPPLPRSKNPSLRTCNIPYETERLIYFSVQSLSQTK